MTIHFLVGCYREFGFISIQNAIVDNFLNSHYLSAIEIVRTIYKLITPGSYRVKESRNKNCNFQREGGGGGFQTKKPSVAGVWIFSGTTQCSLISRLIHFQVVGSLSVIKARKGVLVFYPENDHDKFTNNIIIGDSVHTSFSKKKSIVGHSASKL